ncbi:MAG: molybdopterin dinucleotide binding domain-containing protein, partial [Promethearchaeota archaeon]
IPGLSINIGGPCPYQDCLSNYEFFQQLALGIDFEKRQIFQESEEKIFKNCMRMLPSEVQEDLKSKGYYLLFENGFIPFRDLKLPTPDNRIQIIGPNFNFGEKELSRKVKMKEDEFLLISPSHLYFLHSQLGQLNPRYLNEFNKVFLTAEDINILNLEIGSQVQVSNDYGSGIYILTESPELKPKTALIYSGLSSTSQESPNVNYFVPDRPEGLGFSGAYNSAIIKIKKIDM